MGIMSQALKDQLAWLTRIVMVVGMGIASTVGMNIFNKVDELYTIVKVYHEKILHLEQKIVEQKETIRDMRVELKELRESDFELRQKLNEKNN